MTILPSETLAGVPMNPDTAREISRASKQIRAFTQRRNEWIVQAHREGAGLREIARKAELTHRAVAKIIERTQG